MTNDFAKKTFMLSLGFPLTWILLAAMKIVPENTILFAGGVGCGGFVLLILDIGIKYSKQINQAFQSATKSLLVLVGISIMQIIFGSLMVAFMFFATTKNGFVGILGMMLFGFIIYRFLKYLGD
ncbi:hypothetical protein D3C75_262460 [compost metagenome]